MRDPQNPIYAGYVADGSGHPGSPLAAQPTAVAGIDNGFGWQSDDIESYGRTGVLVIWNITNIGGYGAAGTAVRATTHVASVTVTAGGTNYPDSGSVTFTGGGGTGAAGTYTAVAGVIQSVAIGNTGTGYTSTPTPVFDPGGGAGSDTMTLSIEGKDEASGEYFTLLAGSAVVDVGMYILKVHPYFTASANAVAREMLPRVFRLSLTKSGTGDTTFQYTLYYSLSY